MSIAAVPTSSTDLANLATGLSVVAPATMQGTAVQEPVAAAADRVELSTAARSMPASVAEAPAPTVAAPTAALPGLDVIA
jgi:hypothetical protein